MRKKKRWLHQFVQSEVLEQMNVSYPVISSWKGYQVEIGGQEVTVYRVEKVVVNSESPTTTIVPLERREFLYTKF